jgi:DeoR/GlpR family transcriptional regulator of sugar metabolism
MTAFADLDPTEAPLSPEERRRFLLDRLRAEGRLVAADLARRFGISEDTIRRDLRELAAVGFVQRVHGGALPVSPALEPFSVRSRHGLPAKAALAAAAARLLRDGQTVLIDGGTTMLAVASNLPPGLRLTVVTPSPPVALALADHPLAEVILIGGRLDKASRAVTGAAAIEAIHAVRADVCLLGVCSLDAEAGITAAHYEEAHLKRAMMAAAAEVVAVATADKLGTAAPHRVGPVEGLHRLVTERATPDAVLDALVARRIAVTRV